MASASLSAPVNMSTGARTPLRRISRHSSRPSMSGRPTSSRMTSKCCCLVMSSAAAPVSASATVNSSCSCSCSASEWRSAASSSTISILRPAVIHPPRSAAGRARAVCYGSERALYPRRSALDRDAVPEGDVVLDLRRRRLRRGIIPCRVRVLPTVDDHCVVMRRPLPGTHRGGRARLEEAPVDGAGREIDIALDQLEAVALRQHLALPYRLGHVGLP